MNWHNQLDRFAQRGLKAQAKIDDFIEQHSISSRPGNSSRRSGSVPTRRKKAVPSGSPPVAATQGKRDAEGNSPGNTSSRPALSGEITVQQIRWSTDQAWLTRLMVDKDRPPSIRTAAQQRLRKLGRRKPRL